ncbi:MAG: sigma-70 family RNA polymerase sigma factor [Acidobacteria bacterium]|nr:sigma-70 family RNA polymerase sigma factor [Acidobacteriota bacterium]
MSDLNTLERGEEERLLIAAAQSEPARFAELYRRNFYRIYAFFARRVGNREASEDLTAEVFHHALASLRSFKWQGAPFIAWLYGIASNVLAAHWHKNGKNPEPLPEDRDPENVSTIERRLVLSQLVEALLPDQRKVIVRQFFEQRSIREIAQEMGRSQGAIKQLQMRALENLRDKLGN